MTIYRACEIILLPGDFASAVFLPSLSKNANTKGRKMKNLISEIFKYCFSGYGQFIVFATKVEAKNYIKNNPTIYRIKDLLTITDELREKISSINRDQVFEVIDNVATPMEIEIDESDEEAALGYPNCPNCADQASIAAPGQTVLCNTHDDEKHFREMKEFFIEEAERITFRPHLPFCSCCGKETSQYVGIIVTNSSGPLSFSFCIDCRDELTLKQNAARAALERIGA